jgi:CheY-like chemotaxis protein
MRGPIVLVDDDRDFLEMEAALLRGQGHIVVTYSDPVAALEAMRARAPAEVPALLVTDLMMNALDAGFSLARAVKADPRLTAVPVIIVSAVAGQKGFDFRPRGAEDLAAMGADAFFDKPAAPAAFLARVKELLR